jgi:chaperonin cofactor prefoldin
VQCEEQLRDLDRRSRLKQLVLANLSTLEPDTVTFKNVGKAYICTPKDVITKENELDYKETVTVLQKRKADRGVLEQQVQSARTELQEHLQSNPFLQRLILQ